ncbi:CheR family methyltransferase [Caldimonas brevitalea]|uniref:Chemotaxis protein methyltransferase CheR n=1 Tax=Caldimonas brevitalea TaxID=413882 RepID=A0A0G3BWL4_9BURK|nr:protein-glutamate O-methyltransferase CheR [Caldimonas brevitalea]AKJ30935.1 chemotaxis protein methyltransferase CheR [Caldimonas brevitalea]
MLEESQDATRAALHALLEEVYRHSGEDFRQYKRPAMLRRVLRRVEAENAGSLQGLLEKVQRDPDCLARLRRALTLHVTSMFRDPSFFRTVREQVVPYLRTYPHPRLWVAGCSTGQELYSYRILLEEEGLGERCTLYATDLSEGVLATAQAGTVDASLLKDYEVNYRAAGGKRQFLDYFEVAEGYSRLRPHLLGNAVFAVHNLVSDMSFNEFHLVSCRNVLMYLDGAAQRRAFGVIHESLARLGFLGLGNSESMMHSSQQRDYQRLEPSETLFRRLR